jgi:hypothetical protein
MVTHEGTAYLPVAVCRQSRPTSPPTRMETKKSATNSIPCNERGVFTTGPNLVKKTKAARTQPTTNPMTAPIRPRSGVLTPTDSAEGRRGARAGFRMGLG